MQATEGRQSEIAKELFEDMYKLTYRHTVTCMSRVKTLGKEFLQWCSFLYTKKEKKDGEV